MEEWTGVSTGALVRFHEMLGIQDVVCRVIKISDEELTVDVVSMGSKRLSRDLKEATILYPGDVIMADNRVAGVASRLRRDGVRVPDSVVKRLEGIDVTELSDYEVMVMILRAYV